MELSWKKPVFKTVTAQVSGKQEVEDLLLWNSWPPEALKKEQLVK